MTELQGTLGRMAQTDILGPPYMSETLELAEDDEGAVVATLVRRPADKRRARGAVLHVHGFCDYFFQTGVAEFFTGLGYDFYAVDLRKHGRSLLPHQTPNFVLDLGPLLDVPVRQLSLGQRMRGDIAAALLHDPDVVYLDEPTIGLDVVSKAQLREFLRTTNRERGVTVLLTTHDLEDEVAPVAHLRVEVAH